MTRDEAESALYEELRGCCDDDESPHALGRPSVSKEQERASERERAWASGGRTGQKRHAKGQNAGQPAQRARESSSLVYPASPPSPSQFVQLQHLALRSRSLEPLPFPSSPAPPIPEPPAPLKTRQRRTKVAPLCIMPDRRHDGLAHGLWLVTQKPSTCARSYDPPPRALRKSNRQSCIIVGDSS